MDKRTLKSYLRDDRYLKPLIFVIVVPVVILWLRADHSRMSEEAFLMGAGAFVVGLIAFVAFMSWLKSEDEDSSFVVAWCGDKRLKGVILDGRAGRLEPVKSLMASVRSGPWDRRGFYSYTVGPHLDRRAVKAWREAEPDNPDASLLYGECKIAHAIEARGEGRARQVSQTAWEMFGKRMRVAMNSLQASAKAAPDDPTPISPMIKIMMAAGGSVEQGQELFQAATARDPQNLLAHLAFGYLLCEKWLGSHDMMFDFARRVAAEAEPGSDLLGVLFRAHIERWVHYRLFDGNASAARSYIKSQEVLHEMQTSFDRTMGIPSYRPRADSTIVWNLAAFWFYLTNDVDRLRVSLDRIGKAYAEVPWVYLGDPNAVIAKARGRAR